MERIKDKVAIVGMGCIKFGELWDWDQDDMIVEAVNEALADAGVESKDIQAAWVGTMGRFTGATIASPLQLQYIPVTHVENACATGAESLRGPAFALAAKVYDLVLAVGFEKMKDSGMAGGYPAKPGVPDGTGSGEKRTSAGSIRLQRSPGGRRGKHSPILLNCEKPGRSACRTTVSL